MLQLIVNYIDATNCFVDFTMQPVLIENPNNESRFCINFIVDYVNIIYTVLIYKI